MTDEELKRLALKADELYDYEIIEAQRKLEKEAIRIGIHRKVIERSPTWSNVAELIRKRRECIPQHIPPDTSKGGRPKKQPEDQAEAMT